MSSPVLSRHYPASAIMAARIAAPIRGSLPFADLVFSPVRNQPELTGAGLYACFFRGQLIYIGKYRGTRRDPRSGNVAALRWIKHIGTFTLRARDLAFSQRALAEIQAHIGRPDPGLPCRIVSGFADAQPEVLARETGCMSTYSRFVVASRIWSEGGEKLELGDFAFIYTKVIAEGSPELIRRVVSQAESAALDEVHPPGNTITGQRDMPLPDMAQTCALFERILTERVKIENGAAQGHSLQNWLVCPDPSHEPEEVGMAARFEDHVEAAPSWVQNFLVGLHEALSSVSDADIYYTRVPDIRIRRFVSGGLGFRNTTTIKWQPRECRLLLQTKLTQPELEKLGLRLDRTRKDVLPHETFLTEDILTQRPQIAVDAVLEAYRIFEARTAVGDLAAIEDAPA